MPEEQTSWPEYAYNTYYNTGAEDPLQLKFPRYGALWFKKLSDDVRELHKLEMELNHGVANMYFNDKRIVPIEPFTVLDCPRSLLERERYQELHEKWLKMENLRRTYSQDLCLVNQLFKLPIPTKYGSSRLKEMEALFANEYFGPTNEADRASAYKNLDAPDFVSIVQIEPLNIPTRFAIRHRVWIDKLILRPFRRWFRKDPEASGMVLADIVAFMDALICIFFPCLLTATMFALDGTSSNMVRKALVGLLGLVFTVLAQLLSGPGLARGTIISLTAAYFAVAIVFVSVSDGRSCQRT